MLCQMRLIWFNHLPYPDSRKLYNVKNAILICKTFSFRNMYIDLKLYYMLKAFRMHYITYQLTRYTNMINLRLFSKVKLESVRNYIINFITKIMECRSWTNILCRQNWIMEKFIFTIIYSDAFQRLISSLTFLSSHMLKPLVSIK
jgi:hypothetical protein